MEELDIKELVSAFWNRKLAIFLIVAIFVIIGYVYTTNFVTPVYQSSTRLVLTRKADDEDNTITQADITLNQKLVSTYSELVQSKSVLKQVLDNLKITSISEESLKSNVSVSSVKNTEMIQITVTNENASYAAKIANEITKVFTEKVGEIYNINNVYIVDEAEVATSPSNINHMKDIIMFAMIGLAISFVYVVVVNLLDTSVKNSSDVERITGLSVLAQIPDYGVSGKMGGGKNE